LRQIFLSANIRFDPLHPCSIITKQLDDTADSNNDSSIPPRLCVRLFFASLLIRKHILFSSGAVFEFRTMKAATEIKLYSGLKTDERPSHTFSYSLSAISALSAVFLISPAI